MFGVPEKSTAATVMSLGAVTTGSVKSTTVTVALAVPVVPSESVTLNVTRVAPIGKVAGPSWPIELVRTPSSSSTSVAVAPVRKAAIAGSVASVPEGPVAATNISPGAVTTGILATLNALTSVSLSTFSPLQLELGWTIRVKS